MFAVPPLTPKTARWQSSLPTKRFLQFAKDVDTPSTRHRRLRSSPLDYPSPMNHRECSHSSTLARLPSDTVIGTNVGIHRPLSGYWFRRIFWKGSWSGDWCSSGANRQIRSTRHYSPCVKNREINLGYPFPRVKKSFSCQRNHRINLPALYLLLPTFVPHDELP